MRECLARCFYYSFPSKFSSTGFGAIAFWIDEKNPGFSYLFSSQIQVILRDVWILRLPTFGSLGEFYT